MMRRILALLWALVSVPAFAGVSDFTTNVTATTTSGNCVALNPHRQSLTLDNSGGTVNVGYCETSPVANLTACTAAIGSAGTTTLAAGAIHWWAAPSGPQNQICFISASGTQAFTVKEGL